MKLLLFSFLISGLLCLSGCKAEFEPISYGHDACTECKMTIMDKRYAAEIVTKKGKAFKFDDMACLRKYMRDEKIEEPNIMVFVSDYSDTTGKFLSAFDAMYMHSEQFKTPMNGGYAAFGSEEEAKRFAGGPGSEILKWGQLK